MTDTIQVAKECGCSELFNTSGYLFTAKGLEAFRKRIEAEHEIKVLKEVANYIDTDPEYKIFYLADCKNYCLERASKIK